MVGTKKNKHFGWHARAVSNSITVIVREFNPKAKGFRLFNNRQQSFKERSDANIAAAEGMLNYAGRSTSSQDFKDFKEDTRTEAQQRILEQEYKWKMNQAKKRFEQENPMG